MNASAPTLTGRAGWPERKIKITDNGFAVIQEDNTEQMQCQWELVCEVFAYKIDLFAYDEICLGFRLDATGNHYWVGESYTGYAALLDELPKRYPGIRTDWFSEVAHPAFVENRTSIWGEPAPHTISTPETQPREPWWKLWA